LNYILKDENAIYHECGFSSDNAFFLSIENQNFFITDSRYIFEAKIYVKNAEVIDGERDLVKKVRELIRKSKIKKLIIDPKEWSVEEFDKLQKLNISFSKKPNFSQIKRLIKSDEEIGIIKQAVKLGAKAFDKFVDILKNSYGKSEKELNFLMQNTLKSSGKYSLSFDPIVALNENSALPHALPTDKLFDENSLVLVDAGLKYKRYCSDRTRTYIDKKSKKQQKVYDIVKKAHDTALKFAKEGVKASDIDKKAREVIWKEGYGDYFIHSTGHGVGLDIHELPVISPKSDTIMKENMIFTIEPGIYLENEFGVRYENMVVIKGGKAEIL
jgi:Xaa-Pro aminopeptidase